MVGALALWVVLGQAPPLRATVIDVSDSDAIYEDVSRGLAEDVAKALRTAGFDAQRVDESELPEGGCQVGPCLAKVARSTKAQVLVTLDAKEVEKKGLAVGLTALLGRDGMPLATARYRLKPAAKKAPKELAEFAARVLEEATKQLHPAPRSDAGH